MIKVFALLPMRPDIEVEQFHAHWRDVHAPLAKRITTLQRYVQSHRIRPSVAGLAPSPYAGIAEVWFVDLPTAQGMGADPDYADYAGADEVHFIDQSGLAFVFTEEHVALAGPQLAAADLAAKAVLLLRAAGATSSAAGGNDDAAVKGFEAWLGSQLVPAALALPGVQRVTYSVPIPGTTEGDRSPHGVVELTWPSLAGYDTAWTSGPGATLREVLAAGVDPARSTGMVADEYRVIWPG